jgi:tetratricopeptide (TPR) repeat protein/tRNA A-37 threonylcarbamoyl transferase component Bud32
MSAPLRPDGDENTEALEGVHPASTSPPSEQGATVDLPAKSSGPEATEDNGQTGDWQAPPTSPEMTVDQPASPGDGRPGCTVDHTDALSPPSDATSDWQRPADQAEPTQKEHRLRVTRPRKTAPAREGTTVSGYEILSELGRGGMGVVYKARQSSLGRTVALKMLLHTGHVRPDQRARFQVEAEAIALLQHPNIVQVFEIGEQDQCPFFSLEFVEGKSLADAIDGTPQPPRKAAALVRQLAVAMDLAHRRGIIHRDLKPANVLLSADGTPKITDFGLAKRFEDEGDGQTREGSIMGTPSYMAPEQAAGKTKEAGPPADIYSLGAILYDMLTGRPPFKGATMLETLQQVQTVEPVAPARLQTKVPRDLDTICLKCLAKEPARRYASAGDLAEDLRRFLAGEPILARPTPAWERAIKWVRRRPAVAALVATGFAALVAVLTLGFLWLDSSRRAAEDREQQQAELADLQAKKAVKEHELWQQAEKQRQRAEDNFRQARSAVDFMLSRVGQEKLAHEPRMEQVRRELLEKAMTFYERFLQARGNDPSLRFEAGRAQLRVADIRQMLGEHSQAEAAYHKGLDYLDQLVQQFPKRAEYRRDLATGYNNLANLLKESARPAEAEKFYDKALALRRELAKAAPGSPEAVKELAGTWNNRGLALQALGRLKEAEKSLQAGEKLLAALVQHVRREPANRQEWAHSLDNLALVQQARELPGRAEINLLQARDLLQELVKQKPAIPDYRYDLAHCLQHLGDLWRDTHAGKAESAYLESRKLCDELVRDFPTVPAYRHALALTWNSLAILFQAAGRQPEADAAYAKSLALRSRLADDFPSVPDFRRSLATAYNNRALFLHQHNRFPEAETAYGQALEFFDALAKRYPTVPDYQQELAGTYLNLAVLRASLGQRPEAATACRQAETIQKRLVKEHPQASYRNELARIRLNQGTLLRLNGDLTGSALTFREAVKGFADLHDELPDVPDYPHQLAVAWKELGTTLAQQKHGKEAEAAWHKALDLLGDLAKRLPHTPAYRQELGRSWNDLAVFLASTHRAEDAGKALAQAQAVQEKLIADWPKQTDYRQELSRTHVNQGILLAQGNQLAKAADAFRAAVGVLEGPDVKLPFTPALARDLITAHRDLVSVLKFLHHPAEADRSESRIVALQERLVRDNPKVPAYHIELAETLHGQARRYLAGSKFKEGEKQARAAVAQLQAAVKLVPTNLAVRQQLYEAQLTLMDALIALKDHAAAALAVDETEKTFGKIIPAGQPQPQRHGERVAAVLARCAALAGADAKLSQEQRKELAKSYADRAVTWLRQAVKAGFRDAKSLRGAEDFQVLRPRADFQELLAGLERR